MILKEKPVPVIHSNNNNNKKVNIHEEHMRISSSFNLLTLYVKSSKKKSPIQNYSQYFNYNRLNQI